LTFNGLSVSGFEVCQFLTGNDGTTTHHPISGLGTFDLVGKRLDFMHEPPTVGRSGSASERFAVFTASARSLPSLMYSIDEDRSGHWWTPHKMPAGGHQRPAVCRTGFMERRNVPRITPA
jgi:hypothetical protein